MPGLTRVALRLACVHLVVGVSAGALLLAHKGVPFLPVAGMGMVELLRVHHHALLYGWTVQLVMGVAYWVLPTFGARHERGSTWPMVVALGALNPGVILGTMGQAASAWMLQVAAALCFGVIAWPRVKAFGRR
ncbi:hypothetical protein DL240_00710 [Lujinxingia litoralis]|uniref:Uncharacterized protein n=1 Tax=Lujinxingia litoralis TaxID=2211119 RepID=A0A328CAG5_9DELT|nr:hypothetical protein [Lujinxingia litoralis]RAL24764.1 hypothetical protein DL240_00710 [Lujinxingia litoralis]